MHKGEGHRKRLRERFLASGLTGFQDYEVIELLLTLGTPRKDCKDAAKEALKTFKTLQGVFEAPSSELQKIRNIGPTNILGIKLIKSVTERYLEKKIVDQDVIHNSADLMRFLEVRMGYHSKECFIVIFLNAKNRVLTTEILFTGTLTASAVYPREVVNAALSHQAAALILAHNHPSGDPSPSPSDIAITRDLYAACKTVGILVHEHLIIGREAHYSFAEEGYIKRFADLYEHAIRRTGTVTTR